uniref:Uncharacterized protein n=1 Tax=Compsopogon caeruleus TaxID=31354 RepID=A0A7S1T7W9_9RHOD
MEDQLTQLFQALEIDLGGSPASTVILSEDGLGKLMDKVNVLIPMEIRLRECEEILAAHMDRDLMALDEARFQTQEEETQRVKRDKWKSDVGRQLGKMQNDVKNLRAENTRLTDDLDRCREAMESLKERGDWAVKEVEVLRLRAEEGLQASVEREKLERQNRALLRQRQQIRRDLIEVSPVAIETALRLSERERTAQKMREKQVRTTAAYELLQRSNEDLHRTVARLEENIRELRENLSQQHKRIVHQAAVINSYDNSYQRKFQSLRELNNTLANSIVSLLGQSLADPTLASS